MAQQYDGIIDRLAEFIAAQHVFFVGTAARDGRVNVSPKGLDSLRVLGPNRVVWLNGTLLFDMKRLHTESHANVFWSIGNGGAELDPEESTLYVDDAAIHRVAKP